MSKLNISHHAKRRRKFMGITEHQIELALSEPDLIYSDCRDGKDRTLYQRDDIVVVIEDGTHEIVTLLWHGAEGRDPTGAPIPP